MARATKRIVLVHGAWHGGWCWYRIAPILEAAGLEVVSVDLPGRQGFGWQWSLEDYASSVASYCSTSETVLLGHSLGGSVITRAAELQDGTVSQLIYLSAFVPPNNMSTAQQLKGAGESVLEDAVQPNFFKGRSKVRSALINTLFYHDCSDEDRILAKEQLVPEPIRPTFDKVVTGDRFERLEKSYIRCEHDLALPVSTQDRILKTHDFAKVESLDSSHSPFFSRPTQLADAVLALI